MMGRNLVRNGIRAVRTRTHEGWVTKLDCGCEVVQPLPDPLERIFAHVPEPMWFRCKEHRNTSPADIRIELMDMRSDL
jgi:hypothetical protein